MSPNAVSFIWTWVPVALSVIAFGGLAYYRHSKAFAASVIASDIVACQMIDQAILWIAPNMGYSLWSSIGFGYVDMLCGALLTIVCGEPIAGGILGLSVIGHVAFGFEQLMTPAAHSYAEQMALYQTRTNYGWTAFALSILPLLVLAGGNGGGKRRNRKRNPLRSYGGRGLAFLQGFGEGGGRMRG
jgi:hypothetical protein